MILDEIFAEKPELLNEPCVQKLIGEVKEKHGIMQRVVRKYENQEHRLLSVCMNSEFMVIGGTPLREAMRKLFEIFEKNC